MKYILSGNPFYKESSWVYDRFKKRKEQKMRNTVKILDKVEPKINITSLVAGKLFRYPKGTGDNIYMKIYHANGIGQGVVLLPTGEVFSDFNPDKEIEVIAGVSIYN